MVGPFPPPVIGSAVVTAGLRDAFVSTGYHVQEIDSTAAHLAKDHLLARVLRRLRVSGQLAAELRRGGVRATVYISFAGGGGQFGDLLNVALARLFQRPVILHHHSFAYIRTRRFLTRCVFAAAGRRARHIFLCGEMRRLAMQRYRSVLRGYVLSNAALAVPPACHPPRTGPLKTIGFFSNIELTKGIDRFLELARILRHKSTPVTFEVAGPYRDTSSRMLTEAAIGEGLIHYRGALAGRAKQDFLETIDVLVLPSRYTHEAEPLVILEALAAGVAVIASDRGCIAGMIGGGAGRLLDLNANGLDVAVQQVEQWIADPELFDKTRRRAAARVIKLRDTNLPALRTVLRHAAWQPEASTSEF